jgi:hypothetical protein
MKTTVELPEQLMTEVKVLAARENRKFGDLMTELVRAGLDSRTRQANQPGRPEDGEQWLGNWFKLADEEMQDAPPGPTGRAYLEEERNRLERR